MTINEVLNEKLVDIDMYAENKNDAIIKMVDMLDKNGILRSKQDFLNDVFEREKTSSTGVGMGIAIPHGKSKSVIRTVVSIAKLHAPVDWNSLDGTPVIIVFLFAVPEGDDILHLKLLSRFASMLIDDDFREKLIIAKTKSDILNVIDQNIGNLE